MNKLKSLALGLALVCAAATARADTYPSKPISLVIPFAPGGFVHRVGQLIGEQMEKELGQPIVLQNKPGANGIVAANSVARSAPDGYTLFLPTASILTINPHLYKTVQYDALKDFTSIGLIVNTSNIFVANAESGVNSLKDLVDAARAKPGTVAYGSSGAGSIQHISGELLKRQAKVDLTHASYRGIGPAVIDVIGGRLTFVFSDASAIQQIKAGKLKALAVSPRRLDELPGVPSVAEAAGAAGLPDFKPPTLWYGIVAPAGTPKEIVEKLNGVLARVLARPELRTRLLADGAIPPSDTSAQAFARVVASDHGRYAKMLKELDIRID